MLQHSLAAPPPNIKGEAEGEKGALNKTQALSNNVNYTHIKKVKEGRECCTGWDGRVLHPTMHRGETGYVHALRADTPSSSQSIPGFLCVHARNPADFCLLARVGVS